MSWHALLDLIADEVGQDAANKIESRARHEMGGIRITIGVKPVVTTDRIDAIAPGKPKLAAEKLGVHYSTIYRALNRRPIR